MPSENEKLIGAVVKLIKLTQDGKLKWNRTKPRASLNKDSDSIVDVVYTTYYKDDKLGIYEKHSKISLAFTTSTLVFGPKNKDDFIWTVSFVLEIIDIDGNCLFTFRDVSGLKDLYETVKYQASGVEGFLDNILKE